MTRLKVAELTSGVGALVLGVDLGALTESAARAAEVDALILRAWDGHPRRWPIESSADFLDKAARALDVLRGELPECCRGHEVPSVRDRVSLSNCQVGNPPKS